MVADQASGGHRDPLAHLQAGEFAAREPTAAEIFRVLIHMR